MSQFEIYYLVTPLIGLAIVGGIFAYRHFAQHR